LGRELSVLAQSIVDAGYDVALLEQEKRGRVFFAASLPAAAVDPHNQGQRRAGTLRQEQIELLPLMSAGHVGQVAQCPNTLRHPGRHGLLFLFLLLLRMCQTHQAARQNKTDQPCPAPSHDAPPGLLDET
jgi:hypothetical protein